MTTASQADAPRDPSSTPRVLADDSECGGCNAGRCIEPAMSNLSTNFDDPFSSLYLRPSCDCEGTGFIGAHCETPCSKECRNGGKCVPADRSKDGVESCSCSKAVVDGNPYAGYSCEYGATRSCMMFSSESKHSFCTNGGDCSAIVGDNERHEPCLCRGGFEGSHCEYRAGTGPGGASGSGVSAASAGAYHPHQSSSAASDTAVFVMIIVVAGLIGVLLLAFGWRAQKKHESEKRREKQIREATEDLSMIPNHNEPEEENEII